MEKVDLAGLELKELEEFVQSLGHKKFHARQLYHWIWKRGVTEFQEMSNLSLELRKALEERATISMPEVIKHDVSTDGTQKFVLKLSEAADRIGFHSRHAKTDVLRFHAGRMRHGLRLLPHRQDGADPAPVGR